MCNEVVVRARGGAGAWRHHAASPARRGRHNASHLNPGGQVFSGKQLLPPVRPLRHRSCFGRRHGRNDCRPEFHLDHANSRHLHPCGSAAGRRRQCHGCLPLQRPGPLVAGARQCPQGAGRPMGQRLRPAAQLHYRAKSARPRANAAANDSASNGPAGLHNANRSTSVSVDTRTHGASRNTDHRANV